MQNEPLKSLSGGGLPLQNNCPSLDVLQNESANSQQQRHGTSTLLQKPRQAFVRPLIVDETKNFMDGVEQEDEDDSDSEFHDDRHGPQVGPNGQPIRIKKTRGRVKIKMEFIQNKLRRYTTFSKRKTGIMKKAYELSTLTGTQVMLLVASETGHVYTFATRKLQPMITSESGKALIQTCLNSPDPSPQHLQVVSSQASQETSSPVPGTLPTHQRMSQHGYQETDLQYSITEEGMKEGQVVTAPGSMRYVLAGQTFPMSNEVAQPSHSHHAKPSSAAVTYAVQPVGGGSSITTFFAPGVVENITSNIQLHAQPAAATESPQILTGKLQLHRIHPQNIILTGNAPAVQGSHIILNSSPAVVSSSAIPIVIAENPQSGVGSSSVRQRRSSNSTISVGPQDLVTLINSAEHIVGHQPQVHVVYNPVSAASGGLIFASNSSCQAAPATTHSLSVTQAKATEGLSLQHTPVIRTSGNEFQQDGGSAQRHATGDTIIIKASGNPARSSRK